MNNLVTQISGLDKSARRSELLGSKRWSQMTGTFLNIASYGDKGDGSNSDSAFASAIADIPTEGGVIFVPEGDRTVSTSITLPKKTYLVGTGRGSKITLEDGSDTAIVSITADHCGVVGLWLDGNQTGNTTTSLGVNVYGSWSSIIEDCYFEYFRSQAIQASGTALDKTSILTVNDCRIINGIGEGVKMDAYCQDAKLRNVYVEAVDGTAFNVQGYGILFNMCHAYDCAKGWYMGYAGRVHLSGCYSEGHQQQGMQIDNCEDIQIIGCTLFDNSLENPWFDAIYAGGTTEGVIVTGCTIYDTTGTNTRYGVHLDTGTSNCFLSDNRIYGMLTANILDAKPDLNAGHNDWMAFTPTWTNVTLGSGSTSVGRYRWLNDEKTAMHVRAQFTLGTGGSVGPIVTLAFPAGSGIISPALRSLGTTWMIDASGADSVGTCQCTHGSSLIYCYNNNINAINSTRPFTWTSGDSLNLDIIVELA